MRFPQHWFRKRVTVDDVKIAVELMWKDAEAVAEEYRRGRADGTPYAHGFADGIVFGVDRVLEEIARLRGET